MAILEIPIPTDAAFFAQRVELDGVNYILDFSYNQRENAFYLQVQDENGEALLGYRKIVTNWPMLRFHRYVTGLPPGELWAISPKNEQAAPGLGVFGQSIGFYYYDKAETT